MKATPLSHQAEISQATSEAYHALSDLTHAHHGEQAGHDGLTHTEG